MNKTRTLLTVMLFVAMSAMDGGAGAQDFDFSGTFQQDNDVETFQFTVNSSRTVTLFTSSWLYGEPPAGQGPGGFDPIITLWDSSGNFLTEDDAGFVTGATASNGVLHNYGEWDVFLELLLDPGDYTVALTQYDNFAIGALGDGFENDADPDFTTLFGNEPLFNGTWDTTDPRTGDWALHILDVDTASGTGGGGVPRAPEINDDVLVDFGPGIGFWARIGNAFWLQLHNQSPEAFATGDLDGGGQEEVVVDFGAIGFWARMNSALWQKLSNLSPVQLVVADMDGNGQEDVIADFSSTVGGVFVKRNLGAWKKLHNFTPGIMAAGDLDGNGKDDVIIDFGAIGLWARMNDSNWLKFSNFSPERIAVGDVDGNGKDDLIASFGAAAPGIFVKRNLGSWLKLHNTTPQAMAAGDIDGNGKDDMLIDFGGIGLWARMNDVQWKKLHNSSPELISAGDMDMNGQEEVIADFGASGIWAWFNNGDWTQLHRNSAEAIATGDVDGSTGGGSPPPPGVNRQPTLECLSKTRGELSHGRANEVRQDPTVTAVLPGVPMPGGVELPREITLGPLLDNCFPDPANAIYLAARSSLPSSTSLIVAEGGVDPDGTPVAYDWQWPTGGGTLYSTGSEGSSFPAGAVITDLAQYNRNSVIYEAPELTWPVLGIDAGGLRNVTARVLDGVKLPSGGVSAGTKFSAYRTARVQYATGVDLSVRDVSGRIVGDDLVVTMFAGITASNNSTRDGFEPLVNTWFRIICNDPLAPPGVDHILDLGPAGQVIPSASVAGDRAARPGAPSALLECRYALKDEQGNPRDILGRNTTITVIASSLGFVAPAPLNPFVVSPPPDSDFIPVVLTDGGTLGDRIGVKLEAFQNDDQLIRVFDSGSAADDIFELLLDGASQGVTQKGGDALFSPILGSGTHELCIVVLEDDSFPGTFTVSLLSGGLEFVGGGTERTNTVNATVGSPPVCFDLTVP